MPVKKVKLSSAAKMKATKNKIKALKKKENIENSSEFVQDEEILDNMTDEQFSNLSVTNEDSNNEPLVKWQPVAKTEEKKSNKNMFAKFGKIFGF